MMVTSGSPLQLPVQIASTFVAVGLGVRSGVCVAVMVDVSVGVPEPVGVAVTDAVEV